MSDGQFSAKPMYGGRRTDITATSTAGAAALSESEERSFLHSPSVRREVDALLDEPFPEVGHLNAAPFHKSTPRGATELGRPIASATLVQEYLIGLIFLRFWGWIFLVCGGLFLLGALGFIFDGLFAQGRRDPEASLMSGLGLLVFGVLVAGAGAWFGIFRGRVITEMCWFCPRGLVWMTNKHFEWWEWDEIAEVYCKPREIRPAVGIRFDRNISWISFSNSQASRLMVRYLEKRASAAWIKKTLQLLAEGRSIKFADWRMHRLSLEGAHETLPWRQVGEVHVEDRDLVLQREGREMAVPLDEIPFPSLFTALTRALVGHAREQGR